jgi:predicted RNA-binding protein with PIN domain
VLSSRSCAPGRRWTGRPSWTASRPLVLPAELAPDTTEAARWLLDGARVLLVDGYNVSLALRAGHPLVDQRRWLVERLRPLASRGRAAPVVVFDGEGQGRTQRDPSGVEVRFTASGTIADDEIVFAVAATDDPVLVITDDAELQQRVRAEGGNVLGTVHLLGAIEG